MTTDPRTSAITITRPDGTTTIEVGPASEMVDRALDVACGAPLGTKVAYSALDHRSATADLPHDLVCHGDGDHWDCECWCHE